MVHILSIVKLIYISRTTFITVILNTHYKNNITLEFSICLESMTTKHILLNGNI